MYSLKQRILAFIVAAMTAFSLGASVSATNLADIDRKVAAAEAEAAAKDAENTEATETDEAQSSDAAQADDKTVFLTLSNPPIISTVRSTT